MAIGKPLSDYSREFNSLYKITLDMSGWDKTNIQLVAPVGGAILIYGSNDGGAITGQTQGNAELAINFTPIQATNLATGSPVTSINAAGNYTVPINAQYLRLQGSPAQSGTSVYKLLLFHSKID